MADYVVTHNDGTETLVENVGTVKQVYGFVEFRASSMFSNRPDPLIVALRADTITRYAPAELEAPKKATFTHKRARR